MEENKAKSKHRSMGQTRTSRPSHGRHRGIAGLLDAKILSMVRQWEGVISGGVVASGVVGASAVRVMAVERAVPAKRVTSVGGIKYAGTNGIPIPRFLSHLFDLIGLFLVNCVRISVACAKEVQGSGKR